MKINKVSDRTRKLKHIRQTIRHLSLEWFRPLGKPPYQIQTRDHLKLHFTLPHKLTTLHLNKYPLTTSDAYWFLINFKEIFEDEIYKFETDKENPLILDCGSNIGLSILYFKHLYPESKIIGYEPDPYIFEILKKNLNPYDLKNIDLIQKAIWIEESSQYFHQDRSLGGKIINQESSLAYIQVPSIRLRDHLRQTVDMLKMDIEGAEYKVLMDCEDKLFNVKRIFVEYHGEAKQIQKLHEILNLLQNVGFRYHIKEANPVKHPFLSSERSSDYDLQLNIFAFRD